PLSAAPRPSAFPTGAATTAERPAHLPAGLRELPTWDSRRAPPLRCGVGSGHLPTAQPDRAARLSPLLALPHPKRAAGSFLSLEVLRPVLPGRGVAHRVLPPAELVDAQRHLLAVTERQVDLPRPLRRVELHRPLLHDLPVARDGELVTPDRTPHDLHVVRGHGLPVPRGGHELPLPLERFEILPGRVPGLVAPKGRGACGGDQHEDQSPIHGCPRKWRHVAPSPPTTFTVRLATFQYALWGLERSSSRCSGHA